MDLVILWSVAALALVLGPRDRHSGRKSCAISPFTDGTATLGGGAPEAADAPGTQAAWAIRQRIRRA
jgi:hypothetical protein